MTSKIEDLIRDLLPTAPEIGLFVEPNIPEDKVRGALKDYAKSVERGDVLAQYDATWMGNGSDGAIFTSDRMVFQNHDLSPTQEIRYQDIVNVATKKKFIGGRKIYVDANRGRATVPFVIDFSGKPKAAEYVARFLQEAMLATIVDEAVSRAQARTTNAHAVEQVLNELRDAGKLTDEDLKGMMSVISNS